MCKKRIHVFSLGGTIAYSGDSANNLITTGKELIQGIPEIGNVAEVTTISFRQVASSSLTIDDIVSLAKEMNKVINSGSDGIVVTQGTDTIEETSFILDLLVDRKVPIVVTGAMRNPSLHGADGPANLLAAVNVATSNVTKEIGTVVVFNDEIHDARFVRKTHTQNVAAFQSNYGAIGYVAETIPHLVVKSKHKNFLSAKHLVNDDSSVALYTVSLGDDGKLLTKIMELRYEGLVVEALGGGHVPTNMVEPLKELANNIPVILSSRIGSGNILTNTYRGYPGSETSLLGKGLIAAEWLDGRKSRILLYLLLQSGENYKDVKKLFRDYLKSLKDE